jgi:hypothetical protein
VIVIIISIQPEGRVWQEPEPSQATGMALAHCILGSGKNCSDITTTEIVLVASNKDIVDQLVSNLKSWWNSGNLETML